MSDPTPRAEGLRDDAFLGEIASALCMDAHANGYDHGANPTLVSFFPPYCPRHLSIAANVRAALAASDTASGLTTFAWLIERNIADSPEWWSGEPGRDFTRDANRAAKFSTATAAAATMRELRLAPCVVSEHGFFAASDTEPGLDVERLAETYDNVLTNHEAGDGDFWVLFAAEYARLASPDPTGTQTEHASPSRRAPK